MSDSGDTSEDIFAGYAYIPGYGMVDMRDQAYQNYLNQQAAVAPDPAPAPAPAPAPEAINNYIPVQSSDGGTFFYNATTGAMTSEPPPTPPAPVEATPQQAVTYLSDQQANQFINNPSLLMQHNPNSQIVDTSGATIATYDANGNLATWHDNKGVVHSVNELKFETPSYFVNPTYDSSLGAGKNGTGQYISAAQAQAQGIPVNQTPQLTQESAAKLTVDMGGRKGEGFVDWGKLISVMSVPLTAGTLGAVAGFLDVSESTAAVLMNVAKGGLVGALTSSDPLTGALKGAAVAGASSGISSQVSDYLSKGLTEYIGQDLANTGGKVISGALSGALSGVVSGGLPAALKGAETGGLSSLATEGLGYLGKTAGAAFEPDTVEWSREDQPPANYVLDKEGNFQLDKEGNPLTIEEWRKQNTDVLAKSLKTIGAPFISQNISNLFASTPESSSTSSGGSGVSTGRTSSTGIQPTYTGSYSTPTYSSPKQASSQTSGTSSGSVTTGQGSVGTQALAQALNVGDPSKGTSDVDSPATGGKQQNVWNLESLRVKDATGSSSE
jgi:YD repeat-containing protein